MKHKEPAKRVSLPIALVALVVAVFLALAPTMGASADDGGPSDQPSQAGPTKSPTPTQGPSSTPPTTTQPTETAPTQEPSQPTTTGPTTTPTTVSPTPTEEPEPDPAGQLVVSSQKCEQITIGEPTGVVPEDAEVIIEMDGDPVHTGTFPRQPGVYTFRLYVNAALVDTRVVTVEKCVRPTGELVVSSQKCEQITIGKPVGVTPPYADVEIRLDGETVEPGTYSVDPGAHTLELLVNDELVDTETVTVDDCDETPTEVEIPAQPSFDDPCGPDNASWNVPADTDVFDWEVDEDGHLVVTIIAEDTVFTDGTTSHDYGVAPESGEECPVTEVTPLAPTAPDPTCEEPSILVTAPEQEGVEWSPVGNTLLAPGQSVTYVASAADGYGFPEGAQTEWTFTNDLDVEACEETPVINPSGSVTVDCKGAGEAVLDNSESTTMVGFEVVKNGEAELFTVPAGKVKTVRFRGANPGSTVVVQDGEANELASVVVPKGCPDEGENDPPTDNPTNPTGENPPGDDYVYPTVAPDAGATEGWTLSDTLRITWMALFGLAGVLFLVIGRRTRGVA